MLAGIVDFLVRMLPGVLLAGLIYGVLSPLRRRRLAQKGQTSPLVREIALLLFVLFCGGLALLTLTPRWFHWLDIVNGNFRSLPPFFVLGDANLIPFRTFASDSWSVMILLGNIIMFLPLGFFPALLWNTVSWGKALRSGLCITLFIEVWQLLVGRSFDVDDLLLNTLGVLLGYLLCRLLCRAAPRLTAVFRITTHGNEEPL